MKKNGLETKIEVSFSKMNCAFRQYMDKTQTDQFEMYLILKYCCYDADACRLLWRKRNIHQEAIELSKLSFTPLRSAFHKAGGIKVRNTIAYHAKKLNYSVPMTTNSGHVKWSDLELMKKHEKYKGAFVRPPAKGVNAVPVAALDFASLYPSIIIAHNLSPETVFRYPEPI